MTADVFEPPITGVTVFPDRARVTRQGGLELQPGEQRVRIGPLPWDLIRDSVRVAGRGAATVLGVDVVTHRQAQTADQAVKAVEEEIRDLDSQLSMLGDADDVALARERFLGRLAMRSANTLTVAEAATFADNVDDQLLQIKAGKRARQHLREEMQLSKEAFVRRLADMSGGHQPDQLVAEVLLDVSAAGEVQLELSYVAMGAHWHSSYDLRLSGDQVELTWYGLISQNTGEDWPECTVKLSTAQPSGVLTVPELDPWYLSRRQPPIVYPKSSGMMRTMAAPAGAAAPAPQVYAMAEMDTAMAVVEQGQAAATYTPSRPVAVPSDGTTHRTLVAQFDLAAQLDHLTAPVQVAEATIRATVSNSSPHTLPAGTAALFHEGDFVGSTDLEPWAPNEERELALGVDDRVRVERELVKRTATKATLGSTRRIDAEYLITVSNHSPRRIKVTVLDQLPVSRDDQIVVKETLARPEPAERDELGVITWKSEVDPGASTKVQFGMRVESAKGVDLAGWRD